MRLHRPQRLLVSLSLLAAVAAAAIVAATEVSSAASRGPTMRSVATPRMSTTTVKKFSVQSYKSRIVTKPAIMKPAITSKAVVTTTTTSTSTTSRNPKYPGNVATTTPSSSIAVPPKPPKPTGPTRPTGPVVSNPPGNDRPPTYPPGRPDRPGRPGPGLGVPIIGTGILIGTLGPAVGAPPLPPGPPPSSFGPPAGPRVSGPIGPQGPRTSAIDIPPPNENRFVSNEVVLEFPGNLTADDIAVVAVRNRLAQIETLRFLLTNSIYFRGRITDGRPVRVVLTALRSDPALQSGVLIAGQPNYIFQGVQSQGAAPSSAPKAIGPRFTPQQATTPQVTPVVATTATAGLTGMRSAQYMITKLHLPEAHSLAVGSNVLVAVIDSGIDVNHPELAGVIAGTFDAIGTNEKPHFHGTAIAGAIAARSQLMGVAPAARILAIKAFSAVGSSAEATSMAIIKGLEYASLQNARVINMSFAGPADPGMARHLLAAHNHGAVLVAASGNFGPNSPPQYPAADPNVIAVSATDANDDLFKGSNIGSHITISAPGVNILLPDPQGGYEMRTGTSFAAAHISGIVALILERKPGLSPDVVRQILVASAKDLGAPGRDPQFGAGLADAYQAIVALESNASAVPTASATPAMPALPAAATSTGAPTTAAR